ncbi:RagB/SusD family nutrient uptake outer membrane protein [Myroides odoratimimus]|uniref:RagB/SusD family nutrient uptake outer membrane protein n=1 Tax=Myroides odoratimimus TaxID=76832 RepID=UPI002577B2AF|nr:RagB/SusD family nutrient uptake outer membrane protein [Myroides odoratimimus]MDM1396413.1 RagB/SusD family nutrient uptake outer membrane protein [Myroides odoratimimus]
MKKGFIIIIGLIFCGCSNDFLETQPTSSLSKSDIDEISKITPHLGEATLNGLYAYNLKAGSGGSVGHDDFGQKGFDIYTDMLSGDMNLNELKYGWYRSISNHDGTMNFTSIENYKGWRFFYYMIRGANSIISGFEGKELNGSQMKVLAEAKALRAYMYYNLMMMYTQGYDADEKILPIYTSPIAKNAPAKKTKEVFELMITDLTEAIGLYEKSGNIGKGANVNYFVTKGFLSYVYAAKGTQDALAEAAKLTEDIITQGGYPVATKDVLLGGFNKAAKNPNWMWYAQITLENKLNLASWYGQVDVFTYGYPSSGDTKGLTPEFYAKIPSNDIRKEQFVVGVVVDDRGDRYDFGSYAIIPVNKFYAAGPKVVDGARQVESDYVFMRIEEMYLLNAEVNARIGNEGQAKNMLKQLLSLRIPDSSYIDALNGRVLLDEIIFQTRLELWGEGKAYAAIKRNKRVFTYGSNHLNFPNSIYEYNDPRLTFKVPQMELLNNTVYYD